MSWAAEEMKTVNLGDKRLNKRLLSLFDKLGNSPNLSIPASCGGWHETKAAYRFFDCKFHLKPINDSAPNRSAIPIQIDR